MNSISIQQQALFRHPTSELLTNAQRLLVFLVVSLAMHGLLLAFIPDIGRHAALGPPSRHLPVILTLAPASSENSLAHKHKTADKPTTATHTSTHHPQGYLAKSAQHQHTRISSRHTTALKHPSVTSPSVQLKTKNESRHTTRQHHIHVLRVAKNTPTLRSTNSFQAAKTAASNTTFTPSPNPAAVAALLRHALQQHFHYPAVALQNNWQGKVILGMRVMADGQVAAARILQASGFRILDRAAQRSANEIGALPAARPLLAGRSLRFRVPVAFRLQH